MNLRNIVLIGMPASGKSSVAEVLSSRLKYKLIDTDMVIEEKERKLVKEIFKEKGEEYFRILEKDVIEDLAKEEKSIIATGGGMPAHFDNIDKLREIGVTIFLDVPLKEITRRANAQNTRPLLQGTCLEEKINKIYNERMKFYKKADIIINCENKNIYTICEEIFNYLLTMQ